MLEVAIVLTMLSLLSSFSAPVLNDYLKKAQETRVRHDLRTIAVSLVRLTDDVGSARMQVDAWRTVDVLVGAGAAPSEGTASVRPWTQQQGTESVGLLDDHLVTNAAGYTRAAHTGFGWRGAYLDGLVSADPWGHRYAVNVASTRTAHDATVVISAGPDGHIASPFAGDGLAAAGDDLQSVVSTGSAR